MAFLTLKWILPKALGVTALSGAGAATGVLATRVHETYSKENEQSSRVNGQSQGAETGTSTSDQSIDISEITLEDSGDTPDEEGLTL